jgi:hypothetical protein
VNEKDIEAVYALQGSPILSDVAQLVSNILPRVKKAGCQTFLHAFSGDGLILSVLREQGVRACGFEIAPVFLADAQSKKLEVYPYTLEAAESSFEEGSQDCVIAVNIGGTPRKVDKRLAEFCLKTSALCASFITNEMEETRDLISDLSERRVEIFHYGYRNLEGVLAWCDGEDVE